jgi:hydroxymethylpyrimidine kinase/phosphomethylpyrimidine kinase
MSTKTDCALAIGGLDPGGGAGIAADLRAFAAVDIFGCAAIALTTVQSTNGIRSATPLKTEVVIAMCREVMRSQNVRAIKTGALGSVGNVRGVAQFLKSYKDVPVVVDPVMIASRGSARLVSTQAVSALRKDLLPRATLVTPNAPEAEILTGMRIANLADAKLAAAKLVAMGANAALIKGGHLAGARATDVLVLASGETHEISSERLPIRTKIHGGGCILASLIAGKLAAGEDLVDAVRSSKKILQRALGNLLNVGGALRVIVP